MIWILVPLVAIIGSYIIKYQRNKLELMDKSEQNEQSVEDVRELVQLLKKRVENLEAIAAGEPDEFKTGSGRGMQEIEIDDRRLKDENQSRVSGMADKRNKTS